MAVILDVEKARCYAIDLALGRFECPNKCIKIKTQRRSLTPPLPHQSVCLQFEDRRCAQRFDDLLKAYDPDRISKIVKR